MMQAKCLAEFVPCKSAQFMLTIAVETTVFEFVCDCLGTQTHMHTSHWYTGIWHEETTAVLIDPTGVGCVEKWHFHDVLVLSEGSREIFAK